MGIRVHKALGWGLVDLQTKNNEIIDSRINKKGFLFSDHSEKLDAPCTIGDFKKYWKNNLNEDDEYDIFKLMTTQENSEYLDNYIIYNSEFGLPEVLLINPISQVKKYGSRQNSWYRFDDIIDFQEETYNYHQKSRYQIFDFGIFPWEGSFCDSDGKNWVNRDKPYHSIAFEFIKRKNNLLHYDKDTLMPLVRTLGFNTIKEAEENVLPEVPKEIQMICKYLNLFNNDKTIYQLKPMLYVWWS